MPDDGKTSIPENPTVGTQKKKISKTVSGETPVMRAS